MKGALVFCAILALGAAASLPTEELVFASKPYVREPARPVADYIFQGTFFTRQDHTRPQDRDIVLFTYHANLEHYEAGGPFYIYIKDVFDTTTQWIEEGLMVDVARQTGGALFTFDQRYLGANNVTETLSYEDLEFLTIEQTLSDIATFIPIMRWTYGAGWSTRAIIW